MIRSKLIEDQGTSKYKEPNVLVKSECQISKSEVDYPEVI